MPIVKIVDMDDKERPQYFMELQEDEVLFLKDLEKKYGYVSKATGEEFKRRNLS